MLAFPACQVSIQKTVPILRHPSAPMTNSAVDCADKLFDQKLSEVL